jgi:glutamate-1-semialdehyde 2,1-aminomutase
MVAGLAMLKKLKRENPYAILEKRVEKLADSVESQARGKAPVKVQRFASMFWTILGEIRTPDGFVRSIREIPATQKQSYARTFHGLLERGFYLAPSGFEVSFLSTAHTDSELSNFLEAVRASLGEA